MVDDDSKGGWKVIIRVHTIHLQTTLLWT